MKDFCIKCLTASIIICTICLTTAFEATDKKNIEADYNTKDITINYGLVNFPRNQKPFTVNETMYVPLNFFAETLGYEVENYLDDYININGGDVGRYTIQSDLLKAATDYVGVDTPIKAVNVWSEGLKQRSAAIQYSVMTDELKEVYSKDLEKGNANWVTGVSSPWVEGCKVINTEKANSKTHIFEIIYYTATSGGKDKPFKVTLEVTKNGNFWRISKVNGDKTSTIYTGFASYTQT